MIAKTKSRLLVNGFVAAIAALILSHAAYADESNRAIVGFDDLIADVLPWHQKMQELATLDAQHAGWSK